MLTDVRVLTGPELARMFGVSRRTMLRWLETGQVPGAFRTPGGPAGQGDYRIPWESAAELMQRGYCPADPDAQAELAAELAERSKSW